jgi:hypothetical protein
VAEAYSSRRYLPKCQTTKARLPTPNFSRRAFFSFQALDRPEATKDASLILGRDRKRAIRARLQNPAASHFVRASASAGVIECRRVFEYEH